MSESYIKRLYQQVTKKSKKEKKQKQIVPVALGKVINKKKTT